MVMPSMSENGSPSMSMRSENVPESPSSALQAMYFCAACWSCTVCHLMPVGNAAPPRPRKPESVTARTMSSGGIASAVLRPDVAAMRDVVVEVGRIDDPEARAGEPLLAAQPVGWCSMSPSRNACGAAVEQAGVEQFAGTSAARTGP